MDKKDYDGFATLMASLAENFESECEVTKVKLYFTFLADLSIKQLKAGIHKIINESIYPKFPTIGAIRQAALGSTDEQAVLAWRKVFKAVQSVGQYRSVRFDEPVIHSVIELMGGWESLCLMRQDDIKWKEKEFVQLYKSLRGKSIGHPEYLVGIHELDNGRRGYPEAIEAPADWPPQGYLVGGKDQPREELTEGTG